METWKTLPGFPKYDISDHGNVRKKSNERLLRPKINQYGVVGVGLMKDGVQYHRSLALLIALEFVLRPSGTFDTPICLDGDRFNCTASNLMWRPRWFAIRYNQQFKSPYDNPILSPIKDLETGYTWPNSFECAAANGLLERDVVLSILNRTYAWPTYQQFDLVDFGH